jgi:hypothetical protein
LEPTRLGVFFDTFFKFENKKRNQNLEMCYMSKTALDYGREVGRFFLLRLFCDNYEHGFFFQLRSSLLGGV